MKTLFLITVGLVILFNTCSIEENVVYNDITNVSSYDLYNERNIENSEYIYADILLKFDSTVLANDVKHYILNVAKTESIRKADIFLEMEAIELKEKIGFKYLGDKHKELKKLPYQYDVIMHKGYFGSIYLKKSNYRNNSVAIKKSINEYDPLPNSLVKKLMKQNFGKDGDD